MGLKNRRLLAIEQLEDRCTPSGLGRADGTVLGIELNKNDPLTASAASRGGAEYNIGLVYCSTEGPHGGNQPGGCAVETTEVLGLPQPPGTVR